MSTGDLIFGAGMIGGGIFIAVYGELLFRFVLAMMGFAIGFGALFYILESQSEATRILFSLIAGGIGAFAFYALVKFGMYIAGGVLGGVVGLVIAGILGFADDQVPTAIIALVGVGGVGFFGQRIGAMIVPLATAAAASLMILLGYIAWFESTVGVDINDPGAGLNRKGVLVLMAVVFGISFLAQWNIVKLRRRLMNR